MNLKTHPGNGIFNPIGPAVSKDKHLIGRMLSHKHMIETLGRYKWEGLPKELNADLIERILYYRFKGAMFKFNDKFYFLPFTLKGTIDSYGRYISITPVLFTGQWKDGDKSIEFFSDLSYEVAYQLDSGIDNPAVILTDSSLEVSQDYLPMSELIKPLITQQQEILVLINIDLVSSAKVYTIVARDQAQKDAIEDEFADLDTKILNGKRAIVLTSELDLQELSKTSSKDQARYFQTFQSFDNLRKEIIGVENGGTHLKQEHVTNEETKMNQSSGSMVKDNGLRMREEFCDIVNNHYGLNIRVTCANASESNVVVPEGEQTNQLEGNDDDNV